MFDLSGKKVLITGASGGIGRAIALRLARDQGAAVICVARREKELLETQAMAGDSSAAITPVVADLATEEGRASVVAAVQSAGDLNHLVHNAGVLGGVGRALEVDPMAWKQAFAVNVDAPFFLTQKLQPHMAKGGRGLHVSSGAAHNAYDGWSVYCTTKAALHMVYQCLRGELKEHGILVGSVKPGIVESGMQETIRKATEKDMPMVQAFRDFKTNEFVGDKATAHAPPADGLDTAENVAHFVHFLLTEAADEEFAAEEWDIRDSAHHPRWGAA